MACEVLSLIILSSEISVYFSPFFFYKKKAHCSMRCFLCILDRNLPAVFLTVHFLLHVFIAKHLLIC